MDAVIAEKRNHHNHLFLRFVDNAVQVYCIGMELGKLRTVSGSHGTLISEHWEANVLKALEEHSTTRTVDLLAVGPWIRIEERWRW